MSRQGVTYWTDYVNLSCATGSASVLPAKLLRVNRASWRPLDSPQDPLMTHNGHWQSQWHNTQYHLMDDNQEQSVYYLARI